MMRALFIGDEVAAAGWRLAGVAARVPRPGAEAAALRAALDEAALVLIASATAARIAPRELQLAAASTAALVLVLPDAPQPQAGGIGARVRLQLGLVDA